MMGYALEDDYISVAGAVREKRNAGRDMRVLLIEDALYDQVLIKKFLQETQIPHVLDVLRSGQEVAPYFDRTRRDGRKLPDLILLDLGMPGMDGIDVLDYFSLADMELRSVPIVILTGYEHLEPISKQHNLPILEYVMKPCNTDRMKEILDRVRQSE